MSSTVKLTADLRAEDVNAYSDVLQVEEIRQGNATGVLAASHYTANTKIYFKNTRRTTPPRVLVYSTLTTFFTGTQSLKQTLPFIEATFVPSAYFGIGAFIPSRYAKFITYPTYVEIQASSINPFSESYIIFILIDKLDESQ